MGNTKWRSDIREYGAARTASFSTVLTNQVELTGSIIVGNTASYVRIDQRYGLRLTGIDAWEDLRFPVSAVQVNQSKSKPDQITLPRGVRAFGFDNTGSEDVHFWVQMPHRWRQGTALSAHVHWTPTSTATGNVCWELHYSVADINGSFAALATMLGTDYTSGQNNRHLYCDLGDIDMSAVTGVSAMIACKLFRRGDYAIDTYGADAGLLEIDFHYRIDSLGSDQEATKS